MDLIPRELIEKIFSNLHNKHVLPMRTSNLRTVELSAALRLYHSVVLHVASEKTNICFRRKKRKSDDIFDLGYDDLDCNGVDYDDLDYDDLDHGGSDPDDLDYDYYYVDDKYSDYQSDERYFDIPRDVLKFKIPDFRNLDIESFNTHALKSEILNRFTKLLILLNSNTLKITSYDLFKDFWFSNQIFADMNMIYTTNNAEYFLKFESFSKTSSIFKEKRSTYMTQSKTNYGFNNSDIDEIKIDLFQFPIDDNIFFRELNSFMRFLTNLTTLNLANNNIEDISHLSTLTNLRTLDISNNQNFIEAKRGHRERQGTVTFFGRQFYY
ncbi:leucine-rich repeat domain-containing protein ASCRUDRAFT_11491 [Ascoidea rubescens DSM 1968]|uniref:Uncharacterized protein n=1 Tax=Ascoidea rubescens DSM 1968 TaxID=1344418 RepID=A0A1D2VR91_9ASCO|nr:hypothetical protein ASCRUDRAFT_11491 [Ascoidea rubescens DSM 1968]ODV64133.1 hypothetical protein ASCRUDRAFT_11491 [Ascoidea rubescens DSM 1968]